MKRVLSAALTAALLVSCTETPVGPGLGGIDFQIYLITATAPGAGLTDGGSGQAAIDSARIVLSGPSAQTVAATPGGTVTISGLNPGTYSAELQAFVGDDLTYQGRVTGILVSADENTGVTEAIIARTRLSFTAIGQTVQLSTPAGTVWASGNDAIATVDASGLVRSVANGQATITGTRGTATTTIQAQVEQEVSRVTVAPASTTIDYGTTQQFAATAFDENDNALAVQPDFLWISSDPTVALVDQTGLATGTGGGQATIAATARGEAGTGLLDVNDQVATQLAFSVDPTFAGPGVAISPAVQVEIQDASGALVKGARDAVTLSIGANPSGGVLYGTTTVNAVGGIATFTGISIDKSGRNYTLAASSGGLTDGASGGFEINDRAPDGDIAIYKNFDAWSPRVEATLQAPPYNFVLDTDYFVRPVVDLQAGIPSQTSVIFLTSVLSPGPPDAVAEFNDPAAQANVDQWVRAGGWLVVHAADNVGGGYMVPGMTGIVPDVNECTGSTLQTLDHPLVRGPDGMAGTADDLTDTNIDLSGTCSDNHGNLDGLLPANALVLLRAGTSGVATYATYRYGKGRVIVTSLTVEFAPTQRVELFASHVAWPLFGDLGMPPVPVPAAPPVAAAGAPDFGWVSSEQRSGR